MDFDFSLEGERDAEHFCGPAKNVRHPEQNTRGDSRKKKNSSHKQTLPCNLAKPEMRQGRERRERRVEEAPKPAQNGFDPF